MDKEGIEKITSNMLKSISNRTQSDRIKESEKKKNEEYDRELNKKIFRLTIILVIETSAILLLTALLLL